MLLGVSRISLQIAYGRVYAPYGTRLGDVSSVPSSLVDAVSGVSTLLHASRRPVGVHHEDVAVAVLGLLAEGVCPLRATISCFRLVLRSRVRHVISAARDGLAGVVLAWVPASSPRGYVHSL